MWRVESGEGLKGRRARRGGGVVVVLLCKGVLMWAS